MRVVLLCYYYPPDRAVGALRPGKIAAALRAAGHEVTVVAARPSPPATTGDTEPGVRRITPIPGPREAWTALKRLAGRLAGRGAAANTGGEAAGGAPAVPATGTGKRWLFSLLWLPDDRQGFILPAVLSSLRLVRRADLLYTSGPPFSVHVAGLILRALSGTRWAAEFRDPWTDNPWKPPHVRSRFSDAAERWLEARCLRAADVVVSVSEGIDAVLSPRVPPGPGGRRRHLVARNGIDVLVREPPPRQPGRLNIVHVGTFYHRRDPRPFLEGLARALPALTAAGTAVRVDLVGDCRRYNDISVERVVQDLGLGATVHFEDWVPHERCLAMVGAADLLVILAQDQPGQVPNKLYEYLGTRRPVLAIADADGETARMLRQVGGHFVVADGDPAAVAGAVAEALVAASGARPSPGGAAALLEEWTTRTQMERLLAALRPER